ncbi:hypothetical protein MBAV_005125 [Candidatus Magnetobacterium bavaricum]|uniref:PAC domain-containing protein n=1 Tax=Candidatus Magnetobacterium bavaricum TaxID=29290 RepID=A0A0F3GLF8_9BACT|nr:hypothetical protein MBAV_005125 [Candidatus Magnetobacterium bavaricum]
MSIWESTAAGVRQGGIGYNGLTRCQYLTIEAVDKENEDIFRLQTANISHQQHLTYEINLRAKDGSMVPTIFNSNTLRDRRGNILGVAAFVTNIAHIQKKEI